VRVLMPQPLSRAAFAPFGDVLSVADVDAGIAANQGSATRADFAANIVNLRAHARVNVAVFQSTPRPMPFSLVLLEQHPFSSQLFSPLHVSRYVVIAAPSLPDGAPDTDNVRAFLARSDQAINYAPGVWHHPLIVVDRVASFLMLAHEDGTSGDCTEVPIAVQRLHL
jgi:ureidoglycolate lyase